MFVVSYCSLLCVVVENCCLLFVTCCLLFEAFLSDV